MLAKYNLFYQLCSRDGSCYASSMTTLEYALWSCGLCAAGFIVRCVYLWLTAPVICSTCGEVCEYDHTELGGMMPIADALVSDAVYVCKNGHWQYE